MSDIDKTFGEAFRELLGLYVASSTGPGRVLYSGKFDASALHLRLVSDRDGVEYDVTMPWANRWVDDAPMVRGNS